jgi:1,4-dihydroxy-2-naphthoyl-CoA hydrolase
MFQPEATVDRINAMSKNNMVEHLGIVFTEVGENHIKATMPVDHRTHQPYGLLHGGASVVLAETLGSVAAHFTIDAKNQYAVGLDINANHIRSAKSGVVTGISRPIHVGRKTQVWEIKISDEQDKLVCISRITMAIVDKI